MREKLVYEASIYSAAELSVQAEPILNTLKLEREDRRDMERKRSETEKYYRSKI